MKQGDSEWFAARAGRVTASRVADATARVKSGWGASRANLMATIACERLTGTVAESFTNDAMRWGTETEPQARASYAFLRDCEVEEVAFVPHPSIEWASASPDGMIGTDGMIEIKCPSSATHIDTLLGAEIDGKYIKQMAFQMACTGRKWCDFVSFDPRLPIELQIKIIRVERDDMLIASLEKDVKDFLAEVEDKVNKLKALKG